MNNTLTPNTISGKFFVEIGDYPTCQLVETTLTQEEYVNALYWQVRNEARHIGTHDITPEYVDFTDKYVRETIITKLKNNNLWDKYVDQDLDTIDYIDGLYTYEFSEDFAIFATTGKLTQDLVDFVEECIT